MGNNLTERQTIKTLEEITQHLKRQLPNHNENIVGIEATPPVQVLTGTMQIIEITTKRDQTTQKIAIALRTATDLRTLAITVHDNNNTTIHQLMSISLNHNDLDGKHIIFAAITENIAELSRIITKPDNHEDLKAMEAQYYTDMSNALDHNETTN